MRACFVFIVIVYCFCTLSPARAGAWLWPEGKGQVIVTTTFANARNAYDATGRLIQTPSYRKFETRAYVEHGVTDWLNFVAEAGYLNFRGAPVPTLEPLSLLIAQAKAGLPLWVETPSGARYEGFGIGSAGVRLKLFTYGDYIFSVESSIRAASRDARRFLDMRDAVQVDARFLIGRPYTVFGMAGFVDAQFGYRSRGQNGDEVRVDITAGVRPLDRLMLMAQSFSAFSPRGGVATLVAAQKFQVSAVYDVTPSLSVQLGGVTALSGVNSPAERGVISALWWRY